MRFQYFPGRYYEKGNTWREVAERLVDTMTGQMWFREGDKWKLLVAPVAEVMTYGDTAGSRLLR